MSRSRKALELYNEFVIAEDAGQTAEALRKLSQSVQLGEPMAHHVLGYNEFGKVHPRTSWALRHYRIAASKGFAPSAWNLAKYYEKMGRKKLYEKWMGLAANLGDPDAAEELKKKS